MKINDRPTGVIRITLTGADGAEQEIDIDDDVHFIFAFAKAGPDGGNGIPLEFLVKGNENIVGELFYRIGITHPQIIKYCRKRAIAAALEDLKAKGIDLGAEAFKNAPVVGGVQ